MSFINVSDKDVCAFLENLKFPLDLSDHEFAYKLPPKSIYILNAKVSHSLSVTESNYVSIGRYKNLIKSEKEFILSTEDFLGCTIFVFRIVSRSIRFVLQGKFKYAFVSLNTIISR